MPDAKHNDGQISSVQDFLGLIKKSKFTERQKAHVRLWFRGQSKADWELSPGVYRLGFPATDEEKRLNIERHLTQDFRVQSAGLLSGSKSDAELYFIQQHYRMRTRLLDWTHNPLAALYFAVAQSPDEDGALFMMDAYLLAPCQGAKNQFEGIATSRSQIFEKALHVIFDWWEPKANFPTLVLPVRPDHFDQRLRLQKGCFTFHGFGRKSLSRAENNTLHSFLIPRKAKADIKAELFLLGIDAFSVYGDLESLAERLRFAYAVS
jgi:hypothetical protein